MAAGTQRAQAIDVVHYLGSGTKRLRNLRTVLTLTQRMLAQVRAPGPLPVLRLVRTPVRALVPATVVGLAAASALTASGQAGTARGRADDQGLASLPRWRVAGSAGGHAGRPAVRLLVSHVGRLRASLGSGGGLRGDSVNEHTIGPGVVCGDDQAAAKPAQGRIVGDVQDVA